MRSRFKLRTVIRAITPEVQTLKLDCQLEGHLETAQKPQPKVGGARVPSRLVTPPSIISRPWSSLVDYLIPPTISASTTLSNTTHNQHPPPPPNQSINQYGRLRKLRMHLCQLQLCSWRLLLQRTFLSLIALRHIERSILTLQSQK